MRFELPCTSMILNRESFFREDFDRSVLHSRFPFHLACNRRTGTQHRGLSGAGGRRRHHCAFSYHGLSWRRQALTTATVSPRAQTIARVAGRMKAPQARGEEESGEDQRVGVDRPLQLAVTLADGEQVSARAVLLTADPEPAFSRGSDDMIMTAAARAWAGSCRFCR